MASIQEKNEPVTLSAINKQTIKALKTRIRAAGTRKVEKKLGFSQTNLSYHLNPKDFAKVNMSVVERIISAVEKVEQDNLQKVKDINQRASQSLTA